MAVSCTIAVASCGGGSSPPPELQRERLVERLIERTTPFQAAIIEDGTVTYAEYESAILGTLECVNDAGFETRDLTTNAVGDLFFSYGGGDLEAADVAYESCYVDFASEVDDLYHFAPVVSEKERREMQQGSITCLADLGLIVSDPPSPDEIQMVLESGAEAIDCLLIAP